MGFPTRPLWSPPCRSAPVTCPPSAAPEGSFGTVLEVTHALFGIPPTPEPLRGDAYYRWLISDVLRQPLAALFADYWEARTRWRMVRPLLAALPPVAAGVGWVAASGSSKLAAMLLAAIPALLLSAAVTALSLSHRRSFVEASVEQVVGGILWRLRDWPDRAALIRHRERIEARGAAWALDYYVDEPLGGWDAPRLP